MAKFYIKIQRNVEFSITETVEDHQTNQNKNENKDKSKKTPNTKPRFTSREHQSPSLTHKLSPPNTSIATKHTQPTFKAQISNCTTSQSCPFNTNDMPHQLKTTQTLKRTHTYYSFISRLSSKDRTFLFTPHDGPHQHHHITTQLTIINHTGITK